MLDRHLNWKEHATSVKRKVNTGVASIYRNKDGLPTRERVEVYSALVQPDFDYCSTVWSCRSEKVKETLSISKRKAVRALMDNHNRRHTSEFMEEHGMRTIEQRWKSQEASWLYRILNHERVPIPGYLKNAITIRQSERVLRQPTRIEAACSSALGETMLCRRLRLLFRSLPDYLWKLESLYSFITEIFKFL